MAKITFTVEDTFAVGSRGREVLVNIGALPASVLGDLFLHGLTQKIADAASGAKKIVEVSGGDIAEVSEGLMQKALDGLMAGEWTRRREGGAGVDEATTVRRALVRKVAKEKFGAKSPEWAKFTGLADAEQVAKLDEWAGVMGTALDADVEAELKRRADARKAKEALVKGKGAVAFAI